MSSEHDTADDGRDRDVRRIRGDLRVSGVLRIGSDTIVEGSILAPGGVVLGDRVTVQGDVITGGAIQLGRDCHIQGRVNPLARPERFTHAEAPPRRDPAIADRIGEGVRREAADELRFATLETSLNILFSLAREGLGPTGPIETGIDWGLPEDAVADMIDGLGDFVDDLFRAGDHTSAWRNDEVFDVLLKKVIGLIAPVSIEREADDRAVAHIGRPTMLAEPEHEAEGWVRPLLAVIHLLGTHVNKDLRIEPLDAAETIGPTADPARIKVVVRL